MESNVIIQSHNSTQNKRLMQLIGQALQSHYEVIIFDIANKFKDCSQTVNGEYIDTKNIDFAKSVDFQLETAYLNNNLYSTVQYLLSSILIKLPTISNHICLVIPQFEKYINTLNPQANKYLNYMKDVFKILNNNQNIMYIGENSNFKNNKYIQTIARLLD